MDPDLPLSHDPALANADDMFAKRGCCSFWVPWSSGGKAWEQMRYAAAAAAAERNEGSGSASSLGRRWWSRGWNALMKVREWSELVAGPRWKTFIRRFRRGNGRLGGRYGGKFGYDALSYARNFDDGQCQSSDSDGDSLRRGFSARYAAPPSSAKSSMDLGGRDAPPLFPDNR